MTDTNDPGQTAEPLVTLDVTSAGVAIVRLNRPERHNAFNPDVIARLSEIFDDIQSTGTIRVVLLEGAGKSFSAGADIEWMQYAAVYSRHDNVEDARALAEMLHKLYSLPMPTVALVNGAAIGGGLGLIAACDTAIAVKWAEFRFSEVRLGLTPATISPYVVRAIGPRAARMLFATGKSFSAQDALQMGLIHKIVDDVAGLAAESEELVRIVFEGAPGAIAAAKKLVDDVEFREISPALRQMTADRIADRRQSDEGKEGTAAFLGKHKPGWAQ